MKQSFLIAGVVVSSALSGTALAAPGLGTEVYGARVEKGELEIEGRWDTLAGGEEDGEDVLKAEMGYGVTDRLWVAGIVEFEKEPGESREAEATAIEAIYALGNAGGIDFAVYGEYELVFNGADKLETKLLMQRTFRNWDFRVNLIAEKELESGEDVELEYAVAMDTAVFGDDVRIGYQAFGELGTFKDFMPHAEHFIGPVAKFEIEGIGPEIEIEAGYLFALGEAEDETDGQVRLGVEIEF